MTKPSPASATQPEPPPSRSAVRRAVVRENILRATRTLLAGGGFKAAGMADIAAHAGVATGTVYLHFDSRADLFQEIFGLLAHREMSAMADAAGIGADAAVRLTSALDTFIDRAFRGRRLAYALIAEPVDPVIERERLIFHTAYTGVLETVIADGIADGSFRRTDARVAAACILGALVEALVERLDPDTPADEARDRIVMASIVEFCVSGVRA